MIREVHLSSRVPKAGIIVSAGCFGLQLRQTLFQLLELKWNEKNSRKQRRAPTCTNRVKITSRGICFSRRVSGIEGIGASSNFRKIQISQKGEVARRIGDLDELRRETRETRKGHSFLLSLSLFLDENEKNIADEDFSRGWKTRASILKRNLSKLQSDLQRKSRWISAELPHPNVSFPCFLFYYICIYRRRDDSLSLSILCAARSLIHRLFHGENEQSYRVMFYFICRLYLGVTYSVPI